MFLVTPLSSTVNKDFCYKHHFISGLGQLIIGYPDRPYPNNVLIQLVGNHTTKDLPITNSLNLGSKALGVFGNLNLYGKPIEVVWTSLSETMSVGASVLKVSDSVQWKAGNEIVVTTSSFEPRETEKFVIKSVSGDGRTITVETTAKYAHRSYEVNANGQKVLLAAKVGLLTRNIVIEGLNEPEGSLDNQHFGCRVLVGKYHSGHGSANISNVEFKHCGQYGWNEDYDPR